MLRTDFYKAKNYLYFYKKIEFLLNGLVELFTIKFFNSSVGYLFINIIICHKSYESFLNRNNQYFRKMVTLDGNTLF